MSLLVGIVIGAAAMWFYLNRNDEGNTSSGS